MLVKTASATRTLLVLCLCIGCWAFSFGLAAPSGLCSICLQRAGYNDVLVGLNTSIYYFGILIASALVPWMMRRWGRWCVIAGMIISGVSVALFPWGGGLVGWLVLRLINGVAGAMSLIPTETMVNHNAGHDQRARHFGFYAFAVALGIALGILVGLQMFPSAPQLAFWVGGVASVGGGILLWRCLPVVEAPPEEERASGFIHIGGNLLSFGSAWGQGFLEGGMVAFLATYLLFLGFTEDGASWLLGGTMVGVILFQVPVAWLADRLGRRRVLFGCYAVVAVGLICMPLSAGSAWLGVWLFLLGACSSAFYPLGLALLGERITGPGLARANAWYLALNCLGSLMGPVLMGRAMVQFGKPALFVVGEAAVLLVLVACVAVQLRARLRTKASEPVPDTAARMEEREAA